jgi:hypothetical protein
MAELQTTLQDVDGNLSSKRVLGAGAFLCLVGALISEELGHPIHDHLIDAFLYIVGAGIFGATMEHFAPKRPDGDK